MAGKNKAPLLGWHPPAELSAWVREEAGRRGVTVSAVLNEAIAEKRDRVCDLCGGSGWIPGVAPVEGPMDETPCPICTATPEDRR